MLNGVLLPKTCCYWSNVSQRRSIYLCAAGNVYSDSLFFVVPSVFSFYETNSFLVMVATEINI